MPESFPKSIITLNAINLLMEPRTIRGEKASIFIPLGKEARGQSSK